MRPFNRYALAAILSTLFTGTGAIATPAVTGLGQSWPNAPDVSASPHFHVYAFQKQGIRYIQVNDASGVVRGAIAFIGDESLELPVGIDANRWTVTKGLVASIAGETVYKDDAMTLMAAPQPDGTLRLLVAPGDCSAHPENCGNKGP